MKKILRILVPLTILCFIEVSSASSPYASTNIRKEDPRKKEVDATRRLIRKRNLPVPAILSKHEGKEGQVSEQEANFLRFLEEELNQEERLYSLDMMSMDMMFMSMPMMSMPMMSMPPI